MSKQELVDMQGEYARARKKLNRLMHGRYAGFSLLQQNRMGLPRPEGTVLAIGGWTEGQEGGKTRRHGGQTNHGGR